MRYVFPPIAPVTIPVTKNSLPMNPRTRPPRGNVPECAQIPVPLAALHPLSLRQAQVLRWIADGKRNREIGDILELSERTVEKHVEKIFKALHVETRGAAARWWHEQMLAYRLARLRSRAST
jgi:DNA-binding CsgD family transcriptional regulator